MPSSEKLPALALTDEERESLAAIAQSRTEGFDRVRRARSLSYSDFVSGREQCSLYQAVGVFLGGQPGFKLVESERQDIANPDIKPLEKRIGRLRKALDKLYKQLTKTPPRTNTDGTVRGNSRHVRLRETIARKERELNDLREEKGRLPERVDVSTLQNDRSFKQMDSEGKYLFDFVTAAVRNARKQMVDWLRAYYEQDNEVVDLFYAITHCHGWVRSSAAAGHRSLGAPCSSPNGEPPRSSSAVSSRRSARKRRWGNGSSSKWANPRFRQQSVQKMGRDLAKKVEVWYCY